MNESPKLDYRRADRSRPMTQRRVVIFAAMLPFSMLFFVMAWNLIAPGRLYYCWDYTFDVLPPFVHSWANFPNAPPTDYYIWPAWAVYALWLAFVAAAILVPMWCAVQITKRRFL